MSQHRYVAHLREQVVCVCVGWDRNTRGFHLSITDLDDELVHLAEDQADLAAVTHEAQRLGVPMPTALGAALSDDATLNAGNTVAYYGHEGQQVSQQAYVALLRTAAC